MNPEPLVSVIIPAHNAGKYIGETVHSVLSQSWKNTEIIIVNDNSSDDTKEITDALADKYKNISVYHTTENGSAAKARNYGIKKSNGTHIAFLDADDLWLPGKLTAQLSAISTHPNCSFVYGASLTFGDVSVFSDLYEVLPLPWKAAKTHDDLRKGNSVTCSSVLCRKDILLSSGMFDENPENKSEDYDLWLTLTKNADAYFIPAVLVKYRVHKNQLSNTGELRTRRLDYVSKKWNLSLQNNFALRKNLFIRVIRNSIHFICSVLYRMKVFN